MMVGDGDGLQDLSIKIGVVEGDLTTIKSTLDSVVQELKKLSLEIDNQGLADIRTEADMIFNLLIFLHHLHPRIHHNDHPYITLQLIFLNHHYYAPLQSSTSLKLVLFRDYSATKRLPTLHYDIKSSIQRVQSRTRYVITSMIMEAH